MFNALDYGQIQYLFWIERNVYDSARQTVITFYVKRQTPQLVKANRILMHSGVVVAR